MRAMYCLKRHLAKSHRKYINGQNSKTKLVVFFDVEASLKNIRYFDRRYDIIYFFAN